MAKGLPDRVQKRPAGVPERVCSRGDSISTVAEPAAAKALSRERSSLRITTLDYETELYESLWNAWQISYPEASWPELCEYLISTSHSSWEAYFKSFNDAWPDLLEPPQDGNLEEYRRYVLDAFLQWFNEQVGWEQQDAGSPSGDQGMQILGAGTGVEQVDNSWQDEAIQETDAASDAADGATVDVAAALEALQVYTSPADDPSELTDEHVRTLEQLDMNVEFDIPTLPPDDFSPQ